jgi:CRISPR-associated protein Cst2
VEPGNPSQVLIDDDVMGFMDAAAAKAEQEDEEDDNGEAGSEAVVSTAKKPKAKGKTTKRPSPLSIGRAVSLRPYRGEISFNAVSGEKKKGKFVSLWCGDAHD